jgi:hypothetical protein
VVEGEGVESEAVKAAVDKSIDKQQVELEQFAHVLDVLRSGSSAAPQQAAWMKLIVHGQQMLSVETIEQPLYTCTAADMICGVTGRVLQPWALPLFMSNLTRFHIDLEINPLLRGLMHAHGKMAVPCVECGSATRYIGDSMTIEKDRKQPSVTGGGRSVLCPNGLYSPLTSGMSACNNTECKYNREPFAHIELLPKMPPAIYTPPSLNLLGAGAQ